jgi:hypothetical protein
MCEKTKKLTRRQAEARLLEILEEFNPKDSGCKAYILFWDGRWPLISEMGYKSKNFSAVHERWEPEHASAIIEAEGFLAALYDGEDVPHREACLREALK